MACWNLSVGARRRAVRRNVPAQRVRSPDRARDRAGEHTVTGWGSDGANGLAEGTHDPADDLHVDLEGQHHQDRGEGGGEAAAGVGAGVLQVEPDGQGAGDEHGQDGEGAVAAQDAGQDGGELGDDEGAVEEEWPDAGEAF